MNLDKFKIDKLDVEQNIKQILNTFAQLYGISINSVDLTEVDSSSKCGTEKIITEVTITIK